GRDHTRSLTPGRRSGARVRGRRRSWSPGRPYNSTLCDRKHRHQASVYADGSARGWRAGDKGMVRLLATPHPKVVQITTHHRPNVSVLLRFHLAWVGLRSALRHRPCVTRAALSLAGRANACPTPPWLLITVRTLGIVASLCLAPAAGAQSVLKQ